MSKYDAVFEQHDRRCCQRAFPHTDAAKRISDAVNLHYAAIGFDSAKQWIAVRLEDGTGGMELYPSKAEAVAHQSNEFLCAYICLTGTPMQVCEAEIILKTHRQAYQNGFRLSDPRDIIPRTTLKDRRQTIRALKVEGG